MVRTTLILSVSMTCLCLALASGHRSIVYADSELSVTNDKDKTVYSISPDKAGREEDEKDKERAWEMLKNVHIKAGKPEGDRQQNEPSGSGKQSQF